MPGKLDVLLQPGDIGRLTLPTTRGLHDNRDPGLADHFSQRISWHLTLAEVREPVGAGIERVPRVVGVHQIDPPGDPLDPINQTHQVLPTSVRVAGVEAEADGVPAPGPTDGLPAPIDPL